jgi:hypothetical protein
MCIDRRRDSMSSGNRPRLRPEWLVAAVFLASGASLLVYILAGLSLRWTLLALAVAGAAVAAVVLRRLPPERRSRVTRRIAIGAVSGLAATVAYDVVRLGLVEFAGLKINPFEAWRLFGVALTDAAQPRSTQFAVGTAFHVCNGIAFGITYTVAFGHRGPLAGVAWAFVLEGFMVSVYPGWLGLKALDEFLSVSITGHVAYGIVLGLLARTLLGSTRWGEHDSTPDPSTVPIGTQR